MTTYTVTISAGDGGDVSPDGQIDVAAGEDVWIRAAPQTGYAVHDWYHDGRPWGCDIDSYVIRGIARNASVRVAFEPIRLAVTTTPCAGGEASEGSVSPRSSLDTGPIRVAYGSSMTFRAQPAPGYAVDAWTVDGVQVARSVESYTLATVTADHAVAVTFALAALAPITWRGTVTVRYQTVEAPAAANTSRRADVVLTQADLDDSPVLGPVRPVTGGTERRENTTTVGVKAVLRAGPADADGLVGTLDLRRLDRIRHTRSQRVAFAAPPTRGTVTVVESDETYPLDSRRGADVVPLSLLAANAAVDVAWEGGQWVLGVTLRPFDLLGERRVATEWTVRGGAEPASPAAVTNPVTLQTPAFDRRIATGSTDHAATRLVGPGKGQGGTDPGGASVRWDLRLR